MTDYQFKKELKRFIDENIKAIKENQLSNKMLRDDLVAYWKGQWDALVNVANKFKIKVERRP